MLFTFSIESLIFLFSNLFLFYSTLDQYFTHLKTLVAITISLKLKHFWLEYLLSFNAYIPISILENVELLFLHLLIMSAICTYLSNFVHISLTTTFWWITMEILNFRIYCIPNLESDVPLIWSTAYLFQSFICYNAIAALSPLTLHFPL